MFKFAGDALIVLWPPSDEDLTQVTRRACQCALDIKAKLNNVEMEEGVTLNIKVGVGQGKLSILHVGGVFGRLEYLATGDPLVHAFEAEGNASPKQSVASPAAWALVKDYFEADVNEAGFAFLQSCTEPLRKISVKRTALQAKSINADVQKKIM